MSRSVELCYVDVKHNNLKNAQNSYSYKLKIYLYFLPDRGEG